MKKKSLSLFLAVALLMGLAAPWAFAEDEILHISTAKELEAFAQNCTLMEYSAGLKVQLDADIDLEGKPFYPIPSFSGSFDGGGHTIKNFVLATDGSHQGLFRYLQADGVIRDLKLAGTVDPGSSRCQVGGFVGTNYGTIENCSFNGKVTGLNYVGGIAGENFGSISGCTAQGSVSGKRFTGGIAGYSTGSIRASENSAEVNTGISPGGLEFEKLNLETLSLTGAEDTDVVSDSGGIVGFSTGLVEQCRNLGTVGYPHYGYNVGGIAGRQSGHINGCENFGDIYGRKDVAGIVGQMEPYLKLLESASLASEIQLLQAMVSNALSNAGYFSDEMRVALENIKFSAGQTVEDLLFPPEEVYPDDPPAVELPGQSETPVGPEIPSEPDTPTEPEASSAPAEPETPAQPETEAPSENGAAAQENAAQTLASQEKKGGIVLLSAQTPELPDMGDLGSGLEDVIGGVADNEALRDNLDQMSQDMDYFNDIIGASSQSLSSDLKAVGYQLSKVLLMMTNALSGQNAMDIYDDVSAREPKTSTDGRVKLCVNHGSIEGDTNVGGIAGDMGIEYEFDLENELMSVFTASNIIRSTYQSKCIASENINYGSITAKKDNAGGIAGQCQVGVIESCQDYASVISSEGSFVGGIVGNSLAVVKDSYAMGKLDGQEYVGGIAGYGSQISSCVSLVELGQVTACSGAIAGWADASGNALENNFYTHPRLGAVDGISYSGKAQAVSYEELLKLKGLPEEFGQLKLSFVADGEVVAELPFEYGGSIDESELPAVPEKQGYSGSWAEHDYSGLYFSDTVEAVYTYRQGTLAVEKPGGEEEKALVLAEGSFDSKAQLSLREFTGAGPDIEQASIREKWVLEIEGAQADGEYRIHYLSPEPLEHRGSIELYSFEGGVWKRLDTRPSGSYLIFDCQGDSMVFCAVEIVKPVNTALLICGGALAAAVAVVLTARCVKKKKTKTEPISS